MPNQAEVIVLEVDDKPAVAAAGRANKAIDQYESGIKRAMLSAGEAIDRHAAKLTVLEKIVGTTALAFKAAKFGFEHIDDTPLDRLVNKVRAARLALSPGLGTAVGIGTGIAIESIGKAVAAQARLIDQQSLVAAKAKLSFEEVEQVSFAAKRMGAETNAFVDSYGKLAGRLENSSTRSALKDLGIDFDTVTGTARDAPEVFSDIGRAFSGVKDPADKARLAVALFGDELGEKMLPVLNERLSENTKRFKDWALGLDPQARKAVVGLRDEVRELKDDFLGVGDAIETFGAKIRKEIVVGVAEGAASIRGLDKELAAARNGGGPIGGIAVPINPPSREELDREFNKDSRALRPFIGSGSVQVAAERTLSPAIADARAQAEAFDKTDAGLSKLLGKLQQQRDLYLESARAGGILAASSGPLLTSINSQITGIDNQIEARKRLEERIRENLAAEKSAGDLLAKARSTQLHDGEQLLIQRDEELRQHGLTKRAILDIASAYDLLIAQEIKSQDAKLFDPGKFAKVGQEDADRHSQAEQSGLDARNRITIDAITRISSLQGHADDVILERKIAAVDTARDAELKSIDLIGNQSLAGKIQNEDAKAGITERYLRQAEVLEDEAADRRYAHDLTQLDVLHQAGIISESLYQAQLTAMTNAAAQDRGAIEQAIDAKINAARQDAAIKSAQLIEEHNQSVFDTFKREAGGVFDSLLTKSQSIWSAIGNTLKTAMLTAIKDVVSSRVAASLTELVTGRHVGFEKPTGDAGPLGKIAAALGLGAKPVFERQSIEFKTKLDAPNHLGDVQLRSGAVPVFIANQQDGQQRISGLSGLPFGLSGAAAALAVALGLGGGFAKAAPAGIVQSTFSASDFGQAVSSTGPGQVFGGGSILGGPGGTPGFAGPVGGPQGGFGGILSSLKNLGGLKSILTGLGNIGIGGAGSLPVGIGGDTAAQAAGIPGLGNIAALKTGGLFAGKVGGLAGGALLAGGGILAYDGLRRGGVTGLLETTAGGAAIGAKFGGPVGALVGAGVGAIAGTIRLFMKSGQEKIVEKIKSVYGVTVDKGFAKDPIMGIIKQSFGGNVDVGIRSPQIRELIELYAMTTDQKSAGIVNRIQQSTFANQGGSLVNIPNLGPTGQPVGFSAGSAIGNGITFGMGMGPGPQFAQASPAPAPVFNVTVVSQNQMPVGAVGSYMDGKMVQTIVKNARVVSAAANDGMTASSARRQSAASILQPNFITG